jgi:carboxymethylenebutenolidase
MDELGKRFDPVIYKGAGHGFMRQGEMTTDKDSPDRKARDEGWDRWKKLLAKSK